MNFNKAWHWNNWTFGVRWQWIPHMRFIVVEIGPIHLCVEFELERDYADIKPTP